MEFRELLEFISLEDGRLRKASGDSVDEEKRIFARTVKITEELGELCNEVLAFNSRQRKEKLEQWDKENLPKEFADVIITTLLLAKTMGVDIERALETKIRIINERYK